MSLIVRMQQWLHDIRAATAIEYGMIAAAIALTIAGTVFVFGDRLYALYFSDLAGVLDGPP